MVRDLKPGRGGGEGSNLPRGALGPIRNRKTAPKIVKNRKTAINFDQNRKPPIQSRRARAHKRTLWRKELHHQVFAVTKAEEGKSWREPGRES